MADGCHHNAYKPEPEHHPCLCSFDLVFRRLSGAIQQPQGNGHGNQVICGVNQKPECLRQHSRPPIRLLNEGRDDVASPLLYDQEEGRENHTPPKPPGPKRGDLAGKDKNEA